MAQFTHLDKSQKDIWLPRLFSLLYDNMCSIAPFDCPYDEAEKGWLAEVSPALNKDPRQILLCMNGNDLLGYLQYYIRDELLMIEELQIKRQYQRTSLFYSFCKHIFRILPQQIRVVEAFTDRRNLYSQTILKRLGMQCIGQEDAAFLYFRGSVICINDSMKIG